MATSLEIRDTLVDALTLDLIGPSPSHTLEAEEYSSNIRRAGISRASWCRLAHRLSSGAKRGEPTAGYVRFRRWNRRRRDDY